MDLEKHSCPKCKGIKNYSKEYDAYYCEKCNAWLEDVCDDPKCEYCVNRPKNPNDQNIQES
jgi:hypothetical protein